VLTNQGEVAVPAGGQVFLAAGTIESTRLALASLPNTHGLIGRNLMAHLRSNLTIRIPRASLSVGTLKELAVSALFVKGVHTHTAAASDISMSRSLPPGSARWVPIPRPSCSRRSPTSTPSTGSPR
jgi:hypothetical protein